MDQSNTHKWRERFNGYLYKTNHSNNATSSSPRRVRFHEKLTCR